MKIITIRDLTESRTININQVNSPPCMKVALVTGITGQDGGYLAKFLIEKGYRVYGTYRRLSTPNFWRLQYLDIFDKVELISADMVDTSSLLDAVRISKPDEVYHLAAQSFVGASFEQPISTGHMTGLSVASLLEAVRVLNPAIRFYQASTSELYGNVSSRSKDENVNFKPASPYAAAKLYGYWITTIYRRGYGIFACNGILFNHESPLRGLEFVTRKISNSVAKIALGLQKTLELGNLEAARDWGYAPDYVKSMWLMLQQKEPDDYVIATNETHTVREFVELACDRVGIDWQAHVNVNKKYLRPLDVEHLQGDYSKAKEKLHWEPTVWFKDLVRIMVDEDLRRWKDWQDGKRFSWDAPNNIDESRTMSRYLHHDK
jgi:GDPmannose 4,6-dehydratase